MLLALFMQLYHLSSSHRTPGLKRTSETIRFQPPAVGRIAKQRRRPPRACVCVYECSLL